MVPPTTADQTASGETKGVVLDAVSVAVSEACGDHFDRFYEELFADNGLTDPSSTAWYATADCLAVYEDIEETVGSNTVRRIGRELPAMLVWPDDVDSVGEALAAVGDVYGSVTRHGGGGGYAFEQTAPGKGTLRSTTPYPQAFDVGVLEGVGDCFGGADGHVSVDASGTQTLRLSWWDGRGTQQVLSIPAPG